MTKSQTALLTLGAVFLAFTSCLLDSDEDLHGIDGFVRSQDGQPVADVLIRKTGGESGSTYTHSDGYYWIGVSRRSEEVFLTPVKSGWAFCPGRRTFTDPGGRYHNQDFTGYYGGEVVIDGYVLDSAGNRIEGVEIVNEEPGLFMGLTSVTNHIGYYRFNNVIAGHDYRFTPRKPGCTFDPPARAYESPTQDHRFQDFIASCVASYSITGRVTDWDGNPVEGVTIHIAPDEVTAVTDADGYYAKSGLIPSAATIITPQKGACAFSPPVDTLYGPPGDVAGVDFTAHCGQAYSVSGRVRTDQGDPVPAFILTIEGICCPAGRSAATDGQGRYEFTGMRDGFDYIIRPMEIGNTVEPESIAVRGLDRDYAGQDFIVASDPVFVTVSGRVRDRDGMALGGVEIGFDYVVPDLLASVGHKAADPAVIHSGEYTDEEGYFSLQVPWGETIRFYPVREGCLFIPYARWQYGDMNHESQDFVAHCGGGAGISGYIRDVWGDPVAFIRVNISGAGYFPTPIAFTDTAGYYEFTDQPGGVELTVAPSVEYSIVYEGCLFCPAERVYGDLKESLYNQDYTLSCPAPPRRACQDSAVVSIKP